MAIPLRVARTPPQPSSKDFRVDKLKDLPPSSPPIGCCAKNAKKKTRFGTLYDFRVQKIKWRFNPVRPEPLKGEGKKSGDIAEGVSLLQLLYRTSVLKSSQEESIASTVSMAFFRGLHGRDLIGYENITLDN